VFLTRDQDTRIDLPKGAVLEFNTPETLLEDLADVAVVDLQFDQRGQVVDVQVEA